MKHLLFTLLILASINSVYSATKTKTTHHHYKHHQKTKKTSNNKVAPIAAVPAPANTTVVETDDDTQANSTVIDKINFQAVANQPRLYSYSALAVNATNGEILVSKHQNAKMPIASISKLMTAMVLLDSKADLDEYITISPEDIDTLKNTSSRLRVGMSLRRRDLLLLALMSSENRAAFALARTAYPQGIQFFIKKMNEKSASLGMTHTQFYDPTGLTKSNQSTAEDLAKMVQAAFNYPEIRADTTTKGADVALGKNYIHHYMNSDALVRAGTLQIALSKTGFINEAGHCLVLYSMVGKQPIIMVFLNSAGKSGRLIDAVSVKNYIQKLS